MNVKIQAASKDDLEYPNCPICVSAPTKVWLDDGKPTRYVRCRTCGTVYASPRASSSARYAWLDETFRLGEKAIINAESRVNALHEEALLIKRYVNSGRMLDIGCDLGHFFQWFGNTTWERHAVELSPSAAHYAADRYQAEVFNGSVRQARYPSSFFELVTMLDMLYYVDDPRSDLEEVTRILKPNGYLAIEITGQSYQFLRSRGVVCWLLEGQWTRLNTDSSYLYWFTPEGIKHLIEEFSLT